MFNITKKAANEMQEKYDKDVMGKIALSLYEHHKNQEIIYTLDTDTENLYEAIFDKYNSQFNLKYSGECEISSQGTLDCEEKAEINVCTKAPELIGRLACNLWIYCNGIQ